MPSPNLDSYPPLFRPTRNPDPEDGPTPTDNANMVALALDTGPGPDPDPLPLIDMERLEGSELERACREWGIFRLVNHGVPAWVLRQLHGRAKSVFDLPFESKQGLGSPMKYFWGTPALTTSGVALPRAIAAQNMDWVEGLNVPLSQLQSCHDHYHHSFIIDFSKLLEDYGGHLTRLATTLFEAMGKNLKLDQSQLPKKTYLDESTGLIRVYRYPHRNISEHIVKGMHIHTDSSILSILSEDEVGGLQFLKDEEWFDVKPIPNTLIVNLGDMMQALSDDKYKSVKHKVKLNNHKDRLSICYFVFPEENSLIQSSKYKPFTYNDFRVQVQHDIQTVGWKIGLENFKLPQLT